MYCITQTNKTELKLYLTIKQAWSELNASIRLFDTYKAAEIAWNEIAKNPQSGWNKDNQLSIEKL